jgi:hypothetical protein
MEYESWLKQWAESKLRMRALSDSLKRENEINKMLETKIISHAQTHSLQNKQYKMGAHHIHFNYNRSLEALTFKYLEKCLCELLESDKDANKDDTDEQVDEFMSYIKNNRQTKETLVIEINEI